MSSDDHSNMWLPEKAVPPKQAVRYEINSMCIHTAEHIVEKDDIMS